jgi:hypothetical protein
MCIGVSPNYSRGRPQKRLQMKSPWDYKAELASNE